MTALAQRIKETPMAPYMGLIRRMTDEQKQIVMMFINETMGMHEEETATPKSNAEIIREKCKNQKISPRMKWLSQGILHDATEWNNLEAWDRLTDEQRRDAERLNLTPEDLDARTFSILTR